MGHSRTTGAIEDFRSFAIREDMERAVLSICRAMLQPCGSMNELDAAHATFSARCQRMEGLCRLLWGLAPLVADRRASQEALILCSRIAAGVDKSHPEFWGEPRDYDQRLVELGAVAFALLVSPGAFWDPLSEQERANVVSFLGAVNERKSRDNNWLLFRILVNLALARMDAPHSPQNLARDWERVESFYIGSGWFTDGPGAQSDYYVAFVLHFYSLIYAKFAADIDPLRAARIMGRAADFACQFADWFSSDGSAVAYGRSLTYRCAQSAFWGALGYSGSSSYPIGVAKGILLRNLRWWFRQPIFNEAGFLSVGYGYANPLVAENYTSPSSPYWALKAFLPLGLSADHPFWTTPEEPLPTRDGSYVQAAPKAIVCRDGAHVFVMPGASAVPSQHRNAPEKYAKFCYSSKFGFSLPAAPRSLGAGACDSMLALTMDGEYYRVRERSSFVKVDGCALLAVWHPWREVEVTTWLVPVLPWHVRVHRVRTPTPLLAAEGGYAVPLHDEDEEIQVTPDCQSSNVAAVSGNGLCSEIASLIGIQMPRIIRADVNTNILYRRSVIPTLVSEHSSGEFWLGCAVFGGSDERRLRSGVAPIAAIDGDRLWVRDSSGQTKLEANVSSPAEHTN